MTLEEMEQCMTGLSNQQRRDIAKALISDGLIILAALGKKKKESVETLKRRFKFPMN